MHSVNFSLLAFCSQQSLMLSFVLNLEDTKFIFPFYCQCFYLIFLRTPCQSQHNKDVCLVSLQKLHDFRFCIYSYFPSQIHLSIWCEVKIEVYISSHVESMPFVQGLISPLLNFLCTSVKIRLAMQEQAYFQLLYCTPSIQLVFLFLYL